MSATSRQARARARRWHAGNGRLSVEVAVGVDESDQLAPAQHELIERVLRARLDVARVDDQQDVDVLRYFRHAERDLHHFEIALQLGCEHPGLGRLAGHRIEARAEHRRSGHDPDLRLLAAAHPRNRARQIVFDQAFAPRTDIRNRLLAVELADRDAEIEHVAVGELLRLDAVELRRVFLV